MLDALRTAYGTVELVHPDRLTDFRRVLDACSDVAIEQLVAADIKFISKLARNEQHRRKQL
jgi:hypothetical protein